MAVLEQLRLEDSRIRREPILLLVLGEDRAHLSVSQEVLEYCARNLRIALKPIHPVGVIASGRDLVVRGLAGLLKFARCLHVCIAVIDANTEDPRVRLKSVLEKLHREYGVTISTVGEPTSFACGEAKVVKGPIYTVLVVVGDSGLQAYGAKTFSIEDYVVAYLLRSDRRAEFLKLLQQFGSSKEVVRRKGIRVESVAKEILERNPGCLAPLIDGYTWALEQLRSLVSSKKL